MWGNNTVSSLDFILLQINKQNIKNLVGAASSRDFRSHQDGAPTCAGCTFE